MIQQAADSIHAWVGEQRNQERIQEAIAQGVDIVTQAAKAFRDVFKVVVPIVQDFAKARWWNRGGRQAPAGDDGGWEDLSVCGSDHRTQYPDARQRRDERRRFALCDAQARCAGGSCSASSHILAKDEIKKIGSRPTVRSDALPGDLGRAGLGSTSTSRWRTSPSCGALERRWRSCRGRKTRGWSRSTTSSRRFRRSPTSGSRRGSRSKSDIEELRNLPGYLGGDGRCTDDDR